MSGLWGYGYHDSRCTLVHYEGQGIVEDYCLVCRTCYGCSEAWVAAKEGRLLDRAEPLQCRYPRALVSEFTSRIDELKSPCGADYHNHKLFHYQEPNYVLPTDEERKEDPKVFWAGRERCYHYCINCLRYVVECPRMRGRECSVDLIETPLNDDHLVEIAKKASHVN